MTTIPALSGGRVLGHLREFRSDPLTMLRRFDSECGDIGYLKFPGEKLLVLNSPELAGALLVDEARRFRKSRLVRAALYPLVGDGLFTSEGAVWRRQRKLMAPLFQPSHLARYADVMTAATERCVASWKDGAHIDAAHEMTRLTMSVAGKALFGIDTFDDGDELGEALTVLLAWAASAAASVGLASRVILASALDRRFPRAANWLESRHHLPRRCRDAVAVIDGRVAKMIADRRGGPDDRDDLLSRLLHARDEEGGMTDRQLRDEIVTLFVAGHETTATTLAWAFYLLSRHPDVYDRLEREALAYTAQPIGRSGLPELPLAIRVFSEALRMYPPVPIYERQALEPVDLGGHRIERDAFVAVFPWALHRRPALWPTPDHFDPDRFEAAATEARPRHAYLPFGAGPRVCLGSHFAVLEGALALATIVRHARLELDDATREVIPDPKAATLRPLGGIPMRVKRRAVVGV